MTRDPYKYFRVEAREILDELGKGMLDLEKGTAAPELVPRLLRLAHTLKGAARVVKQPEIADQAHAMEDALAMLRDRTGAPAREPIDAVLMIVDRIGALVGALGLPTSTEPRPPADRTLRADVGEMDALIDGIAEAQAQLAGLRGGLALLEPIRHRQELLVDQLRSPRAQRPGDGAAGRTAATAEELGALIASLEASAAVGVEQVDRELRQIREAAERLRLLPVALMFNVLERTARDAARSLGRRVDFDARGGEVRLDAQVLGAVQNALVQVVRNAVAHGIESEAERTTAGKLAVGRVTLDVARRGNRVWFRCRDDGRGVDLEAVRRAAQRKGALPAEARTLGPDAMLRLLLEGGITTSRTVTEMSGRGIGLDLVREEVNRLGGEVSVSSESSRGTSFEIIVPVSRTSLEALLVEAGGRTAVIPLDAVRRTIRVGAGALARTSDGQSIAIDGTVIPFAPLARSLRAPEEVPRSAWSAVVVESSGRLAAVGVDRLLGTETRILRPLPRHCPADPVVAGTSLDADGNPQLVLDPEALVAEAGRAVSAARPVARPSTPILVIDDSLTTRMLEQSILESAGYEVDLADSGEDGLAKARRRPYALFLVDVEMPGMDGFEFVGQVRADPDLRDVPAILVTSRSAPEDRRRGEEVGARAYIAKSEFDQTDLLERIRRLVK